MESFKNVTWEKLIRLFSNIKRCTFEKSDGKKWQENDYE